MQSITITVQHLRSLVEPVLPFAGRGDMLPVLTGVHIKSHGKWLVATTTDRFRVGMKRVAAFDSDRQPVEWPPFEALIGTATLKSILTTFKGPRYLDPELTFSADGDTLEVEASGGLMFARASIAYRLMDGEYPNVASIIRKAMETEGTAPDAGFDSAFMADFKAVGRTLTMKRGSGERDPIFITDGEDFVGALMPRKLVTDTPAASWDDVLSETKAAPRKAAKKAAVQPERISA
jgi:hypothetical protein